MTQLPQVHQEQHLLALVISMILQKNRLILLHQIFTISKINFLKILKKALASDKEGQK
jgi:hypothetical protein